MLIFSEEEIRGALTMDDAIRAVEGAFAALSRGEARLPGVIGLDIPESRGEVHVKGAHLAGAPFYVFKVASGFWSNAERGLPVSGGLMMAFDAATGQPAAILLDNGYLTDLRTGAAGGVAAKYLAKKRPQKIAMIGAGIQGRFQLQALARVLGTLPPVAAWSLRPENAVAYAREMAEELGAEVEAAPTVEAAVRGADLIVTSTPSREPLIRAEWLAPGAHVTAVGSDGPEKQELHVDVLARADRVFADRLSQCIRLGEIHHAVEAGALREEDVAGELGDLILGRVPGRETEQEITVADLTGVGVQDAAIAAAALQALGSRP
jgi:ornithine cyclodeaminase